MTLTALVDQAVSKVAEYCAQDETRAKLEARIVGPALRYLTDRFAWGVRLVQAVVVLVFVQTLILVWLLVRDVRRAAPGGA